MRTRRSFVLAATAVIVAVMAGGQAVADRHGAISGRQRNGHGDPAQGQPAQGQPAQGQPAQGQPAASDDIDRRWVDGMVAHHAAALEMAQVVIERSRDPKIRYFAQSVIDDQRNEIQLMDQLAQEKWGYRPARQRKGPMGVVMGMPISMDMSTMTGHMRAAPNVERAFLQMIIPHHAAAIIMAQDTLDRASDFRFTRQARAVISTQAREIARAQALLDRAPASTNS